MAGAGWRATVERVSTVAAKGPPVLDRVPPIALVLAGIGSVQFGAALATTMFDELGPAGASALRLVFAAVALAAVARPSLRHRPRGALKLALGFGLALGVMNLTFYEALDRLPLGIAVTIEFAGPLGVAVALSRSRLDLVWAALAAAGILLLSGLGTGGAAIDGLGVAFALAAAACWAAYILLAQRVGQAFPGMDGLAIAMVIAALVPLGPGIAEAGGALVHPELLALGAGVALLSSVIPYALEIEALRRLPANVFGILMSLEPAVAALAGLILLGQDLAARELVAMALVIAASAGVSRTAPPPPEA